MSQIECRLLTTWAREEAAVEKFRRGDDQYCETASIFYGRPITKADVAERGVGKQIILSCLGSSTYVLTNRGCIPITDVVLDDQLWDGEAWVRHKGLLARGIRETVNVYGVNITPDHCVLSVNGWVEARNLHDENILSQVLVAASENLPLQAMNWVVKAACDLSSFNVHAVPLNIPSYAKIYGRVNQKDVTLALKKLRGIGQKNITVMPIYARTIHTDDDYSVEFQSFIIAVGPIAQMNIMAAEAYRSVKNGEAPKDGVYSWLISLLCPDGINQNWKLIELKLMRVIGQETFVLLTDTLKCKIDEVSDNLKMKLPVYDIACSGPNNRFTIVSSAGPLIAHNCGYGAGASTIVRTARNGTYGPPVVLTLDQGLQLRDLYRGQHKMVCALWEQLSIAMFSLYAGTEMDLGAIQIGDRRIWAPGGLWMDFTSLKWDVKEKAWKHAVRGHERKTYGSRVVQNCVELMGRNLISTAMVAINRELKLKIPLTVHDDIVVVLPDDENEAKHLLNEACKIVERVPDWMPELPLKVEAKIGENLE